MIFSFRLDASTGAGREPGRRGRRRVGGLAAALGDEPAAGVGRARGHGGRREPERGEGVRGFRAGAGLAIGERSHGPVPYLWDHGQAGEGITSTLVGRPSHGRADHASRDRRRTFYISRTAASAIADYKRS